MIEPELICGVAKPIAKIVIKKLLDNKSQKWWTNIKGLRQGKEFPKSVKVSADLLSHDARAVRVGLHAS